MIYRIIDEFYAEVTGRPLLTGMVIAHQTFGDMLRWNPHFHAIVLEGGFDDEGTFFYIPFSGLQSMVEVFRRRVIKLLVQRELSSLELSCRGSTPASVSTIACASSTGLPGRTLPSTSRGLRSL